MATSILAELESKGSEKTRLIYARHGMAPERTFGVSVAELKLIAKTIKGQQALAGELYESGVMDAMYLAGMVADGSKMSEAQLHAWAEGAGGLQMIAEHTVPWVAVESSLGWELAMAWIGSQKEHIASSGWCTFSGLVATRADDKLDLGQTETLLDTVVQGIDSAPNRVRYTMNGFVIAVGIYVRPLLSQAKAAAARLGQVTVEMGATACEVPLATAYIEKAEAAGKVGVKRKTIRC